MSVPSGEAEALPVSRTAGRGSAVGTLAQPFVTVCVPVFKEHVTMGMWRSKKPNTPSADVFGTQFSLLCLMQRANLLQLNVTRPLSPSCK